jgi:NADH:ubiquinone oxidoreductase subunit F (NADH-binding)/NAD-dependent dihydropyrimidine dehydrogenase PreA subunit/(2Fe-2S) ferredoxin
VSKECQFCNIDPGEIKVLMEGDVIEKLSAGKKSIIDPNKRRITIGMATCGIAAGAEDVYDGFKRLGLGRDVVPVGCVGMCYEEPIVMVFEGGKQWIYGNVKGADIEILGNAIKNSRVYKKLLLGTKLEDIPYYKKQKRLVTENCGMIEPTNLSEYVIQGGFRGLLRALVLGRDKTIEEIKTSGLRGRGGAGFPTYRKWTFLSNSAKPKFQICNADEGDPGAFMNRSIMEGDPYRVLEGLIIAAFAIGAEQAFVYTRIEYPLAIKTMDRAIKTLYEHNLLGKNILGQEGFNLDIRIRRGAGAFVCGEETALMNSIEGKRGHPRPRPPYPAQSGLFFRPTNINNVGTLSHVATIMRMGGKKYAKIGTKDTKGTKIICLTGKIKRAGVIEVPMGISLREIIYDIGGGVPDRKKLKAIQSGGPSGGCIPAEYIDAKYDYASIIKLGAIMGSGGLVVMDSDNCMVNVARFFLNFTKDESCGKCTPCREGNTRMFEMLVRITEGKGKPQDIAKLEHLGNVIKDTALCGLGNTAPNPVLTTIRYFREEYEDHIIRKRCKTKTCNQLLRFFITDRCVGCGVCQRNCPVQCISGENKDRRVIDQEKCIRCGTCHSVCPFLAIEVK